MESSEQYDEPITDSLSETVTNAIRNTSKEYSDPLEAPDFDAISFINQQFPSEESLDRLDPFLDQTSARLAALDAEISQAVEAQSRAGERAAQDIEAARGAVRDLFGRVEDIREKAQQSEVMVQDICQDIKQLDYAKGHLQETITALKRLHMLAAAVERLRDRAGKRDYREAANLVDAVRQLLTHFEAYGEVPKIAELRETYSRAREDLAEQIFEAFNKVGRLAAAVADAGALETPPVGEGGGGGGGGGGEEEVTPGEFRSLAEACLVVDALGAAARRRQVGAYCRDALSGYARVFRRAGDAASLDQVDRRFHWFRRLLRGADQRLAGVFPPHWRAAHRLCLEFLRQTRADLVDILERTPEGQLDVKILVKALQRTLVFEREMRDRFEAPREQRQRGGGGGGGGGGAAAEQGPGDAGADAAGGRGDGGGGGGGGGGGDDDARRRYRRRLEDERRAREGGRSMFQTFAKDGTIEEEEEELPAILGLVSTVFDPFMGPYVDLETQALGEELRKAALGEAVGDGSGAGRLPVFTSSTSIFGYMKGGLKRCTALTTGQTLLGLAAEFNKVLAEYAMVLKDKLPAQQTLRDGTTLYKIPDGEEQKICYIVNTAEYCAETLPQLAEMIRSRIDEPYKDSISTEQEQEYFFEVVAQAVRVLVAGLCTRFDPAYKSMSKTNWGNLEMVGEESEYVVLINETIAKYVPIMKKNLSALYFRSFCDKFAAAFITGYLNQVLRLGRVNEQGTQQLLLDLYNLKSLMLGLHNIGAEEGTDHAPTPTPLSYTKFATRQLGRVEALVKLAGTPAELLSERFRLLLPDGAARELLAIMSLKGIRKNDQQIIFDTLGFGSVEEAEAAAREAAGSGGGGSAAAAAAPSSSSSRAGAGDLKGVNVKEMLRGVNNDRAAAVAQELAAQTQSRLQGLGQRAKEAAAQLHARGLAR